MNSSRTGSEAEELAAQYLIKRGYRILHRNRQFYGVEVDIAAIKDGEVSIFEVKARQRISYAVDSLRQSQINRLKRAAKFFKEPVRLYLIACADGELEIFEIID